MPGVRRISTALLLLSACVAFAVVMGAAPTAHGADASPPTEGQAELQPEGVEIKSARTMSSDTFGLPNDERETRLYETPVNEEVSPGQWEPIEEEPLDRKSVV